MSVVGPISCHLSDLFDSKDSNYKCQDKMKMEITKVNTSNFRMLQI